MASQLLLRSFTNRPLLFPHSLLPPIILHIIILCNIIPIIIRKVRVSWSLYGLFNEESSSSSVMKKFVGINSRASWYVPPPCLCARPIRLVSIIAIVYVWALHCRSPGRTLPWNLLINSKYSQQVLSSKIILRYLELSYLGITLVGWLELSRHQPGWMVRIIKASRWLDG